MPSTIDELFSLRGRTALITGGTGWLGTALSAALAEAGANVVVSSRDQARASAAVDALPRTESPAVPPQRHFAVMLDHMQEDSLHEGFAEALRCTGRLDILVNNGLEACGKDLRDVTFDEFARHQVNNAGYFCLARRFRDHIVDRQATGSIVMLGSMYGQVASYPTAYEGVCAASPVAYHALKGGTIHMVRHMAVYWAADGVRVNALSPGPFPSDKVPAELPRRLAEHSPMRRMGRPHELKGALLLLASDAGSYITGHNLVVDGGWTSW